MAELNKTELKAIFKAGAKPTEAQFASLIESQINTVETASLNATGSTQLVPASGFFNLRSVQPFIGLVTTNPTTGSGISMHAGFSSDLGFRPLPNSPFIKTNGGFDIFMDNGDASSNSQFRIFKDTGGLPGIAPGTELLKLNEVGGLSITGSLTSSGDINITGSITCSFISASGTIIANTFQSSTTTLSVNDSLNVVGNITASGNISASGNITSSNIHIVDEHPKVNLRPNTANGDPQVTFKNSLGEMRGHIRVGITNNTSSFMSIGADTTDPSNPTTSMEKQLYLSASGDVGIGFMDPSEKLMVSGNLKVIDEHPKLFIQSNAASGDPTLQFKSGDGSTMATIRCDVTNNVMNQLSIGSGTNETHLVVDANGNIGVGLLTPGEKLTVTGNVSASGALTVGALTANGAMDLNATTLDIDASSTVTIDSVGLSIDSTGVAANITSTTDGAAEDFTIALAGATDSSLILSSTGTGADALQITTTAGGIDISATGNAAGEDIDISSAASVNVTATENAANAIYLRANGGTSETIKIHSDQGTGAGSIELLSDVGGITLTGDTDHGIILGTGVSGAPISIGHTTSETTVNDNLSVTGDLAVDGTANLDAVDIDGAVQLDSTLTVGVDDTGYDVKFFGATSGQFLLWDQSADELVLNGDSKLSFHDAAGGENIIASADGHLEINAGTTLDMTAPTVDINASTEVTIDTDTLSVLSANSQDPHVIIKNTTNNNKGSRLSFIKDKGAAGADGDTIGIIQFVGDNDAQEQTTFGLIKALVNDASDGAEEGVVAIQVASHDGELNDGIVVISGDVEDEVDITLGNGAASVITIPGHIDLAGDIDVDGTANLDNTDIDGTLVVDGSNISLDSTTTLNIDNSNTSNGITIGTATSGVPISVGHTTSETTVNDNLTVTGTTTFTGAQVGQKLTIKNITDNVDLTAAESGKLCVFSDADGAFVRLPDSGDGSLVGVYYDFYVGIAATSNTHTISFLDPTNEDFEGYLHSIDGDGASSVASVAFRALNSDGFDVIAMNGTDTGTVGTAFRITNIAADRWYVTGHIAATGTPATPFVAS